MKHGKEYFEMLSTEEKEAFEQACQTCHSDRFRWLINDPASKHSSFREFIGSAFSWSRSVEGHNYWEEISHRKEIED
jgi:hypothetical protein